MNNVTQPRWSQSLQGKLVQPQQIKNKISLRSLRAEKNKTCLTGLYTIFQSGIIIAFNKASKNYNTKTRWHQQPIFFFTLLADTRLDAAY